MSLWDSLFDGDSPRKNDLIRRLAKQRVREDPMMASMGINETTIDFLGRLEYAGLPENVIVSIIETYARLKKRGVPDREILGRIEKRRSSISSGKMPQPLNLETYIQYRLELEHSHGVPISASFVAEAVRVCRTQFGC
jgi:hypothetical protein